MQTSRLIVLCFLLSLLLPELMNVSSLVHNRVMPNHGFIIIESPKIGKKNKTESFCNGAPVLTDQIKSTRLDSLRNVFSRINLNNFFPSMSVREISGQAEEVQCR